MHVTKAEARVLNLLAEEYCDGCEGDLITFLERAYLVWFDYFPEPHTPDIDVHEMQWRLHIRKKVFTYELYVC
jgi:hypothetical protein